MKEKISEKLKIFSSDDVYRDCLWEKKWAYGDVSIHQIPNAN